MPRLAPTTTIRLRVFAGLLVSAATVLPSLSPAAADPLERGAELVTGLLPIACRLETLGGGAISKHYPDAAIESPETVLRAGVAVAARLRVQLPSGELLIVQRTPVEGALRRLVIEYHDRHGRPRALAISAQDCRIRAARGLRYDDESRALELLHLDEAMTGVLSTELLNPPPPPGSDPGGAAVAVVDSGVNYLLPTIASRLARSADGRLAGFDFWDLDDRPFDAHPAHNAFFVQRHGTRIASLIAREAPYARLLPYRYPRPDMRRMTELVEHAHGHGARIVNLSLGGNRAQEWTDFAAAARAHPDTLFVVSAGNNGRDLDKVPVYPAALELDNLLTVTSSNLDGSLARGSNWGSTSVDLLVPGEDIAVTGFDGGRRYVSGSSYAAARVSALAARLLAEDPQLNDGIKLKAAILADVETPPEDESVAHGWLRDPLELPTGSGTSTTFRIASRHTVPPARAPGSVVRPALTYLRGSGWTAESVLELVDASSRILAQCGVHIRPLSLFELATPAHELDVSPENAAELLRHQDHRPLIMFVRDTRFQPAFDAMAFGSENSALDPHLRFTAWVTYGLRDPSIAVAHEFAHVLMDSGMHTAEQDNLMQTETTQTASRLSPTQCRFMRRRAYANGFLVVQ